MPTESCEHCGHVRESHVPLAAAHTEASRTRLLEGVNGAGSVYAGHDKSLKDCPGFKPDARYASVD